MVSGVIIEGFDLEYVLVLEFLLDSHLFSKRIQRSRASHDSCINEVDFDTRFLICGVFEIGWCPQYPKLSENFEEGWNDE